MKITTRMIIPMQLNPLRFLNKDVNTPHKYLMFLTCHLLNRINKKSDTHSML